VDLLAQRYRLLDRLGEGGMAVVFRAEDTMLGRVVAVKLLRETYARDEAFLQLFLQEARTAASLSHPNIVSVYDTGEDQDQHYIVMEYVPGHDLRALIDERGPLAIGEAVDYAIQLCAGLAAAHSRGMVHRDVKPQNLLITPDGTLKIVDFGIARALGGASFTKPGEVYGSVHFLSPEQARGQRASPASDIYAAGVVIYEMLTKRRPFEGENVHGILYQHLHEAPPPPSQFNPRIPRSLEAIVLQALAKTPERRFLEAGAMERAFRGFAQAADDRTGAIPLPPAAPVRTQQPASVVAAARPQPAGFDWLLAILIVATIACLILIAVLGVAAFREYTAGAAGALAFPVATVAPNGSPPATSGPPATAGPPPAEQVVVPNVEGMDAATAKRTLEAQRLVYQPVEVESKDQKPGIVLRQSPLAGSPIPPGQPVQVTLSKAPPQATVPGVTNMPVADAEKRLRDAGFTPARRDEFNREIPAGNVTDQNPKPNAPADPGSQVTLIVSKGPEPVQRGVVPNVIGLREDDAKKLLVQAGFQPGPYINYQGRDQVPDSARGQVCNGCVLSTTPAPGAQLPAGTFVLLAVRKD
jgi:serine/threonine-protein kinase